MRKYLIPAFILVSTIAAAAPAAAQWAPPQGYANGYYQNQGQGRRLEARIMQIRREIAQLDRRNILSNREARRLDAEARSLEYRVRQLGYNGIDRRERYNLERQIAQLEQRIRYQATDGNRRYGNNDNYRDRDRDGRNDRYEDDRGRDHDGRRGDRDDDHRRDRDD